MQALSWYCVPAQATYLILDKEAMECNDFLYAFGLACRNLMTYNTNSSSDTSHGGYSSDSNATAATTTV